jgi:hypothetical protein
MQKITIMCSEEQAAPIGCYLISKRVEFSTECCGDAPSASHNRQITPCSTCGGSGMSVVWNFCPDCGRRL